MTTVFSSPCQFLAASSNSTFSSTSTTCMRIPFEASCASQFAGRKQTALSISSLNPWEGRRKLTSARQRHHSHLPHHHHLSCGNVRKFQNGAKKSCGATASEESGSTTTSDSTDAGPHASKTDPSESDSSHSHAQASTEGEKVNASSSNQNQSSPKTLTSLDSYFEKLEGTKALLNPKTESVNAPATPPATPASQTTVSADATSVKTTGGTTSEVPDGAPSKVKSTLGTLDSYFDKLRPPPPPPPPKVEDPAPTPSTSPSSASPSDAKPAKEESELSKDEKEVEAMEKRFKEIVDKQVANSSIDMSQASTIVRFGNMEREGFEKWAEQKSLQEAPWAMSLMISINILVYILELVTPKLLPGSLLTSIPGLYMAKVNDLLVAHEWWRLITPSFLHDGFFHLVTGTLFLGFIGPIVETAFGSLGFLGIYILGGAFGNLLSFIQTQDITVGGTGPIYALAGAWLVYVIKNREEVGTNYADGEIVKVLFFGGLNIWVGSDLPVDDWTHIGAALGGVLYALLAAPRLRATKVIVTQEVEKSQSQSQSQSKPAAANTSVQTLLMSEGPGSKQQIWIYALTLGILVLCYEGTLSDTFVNAITNLKFGEDDFRDMI